MIELIIATALIGVLIGYGVPSFGAWMRNSKMRGVAESLQAQLKLAQFEAIRLNQPVVFALTNDAPLASPLPSAAANGKNWMIGATPRFDAPPEFIEGGTLSDVASTVGITGPVAICFNSNGRLAASARPGIVGASCVGGAQFFEVVTPAPTPDDRPLRVTVSLAGVVRLCDPGLPPLSQASPSGCPA